jgi:hypothetical protein
MRQRIRAINQKDMDVYLFLSTVFGCRKNRLDERLDSLSGRRICAAPSAFGCELPWYLRRPRIRVRMVGIFVMLSDVKRGLK